MVLSSTPPATAVMSLEWTQQISLDIMCIFLFSLADQSRVVSLVCLRKFSLDLDAHDSLFHNWEMFMVFCSKCCRGIGVNLFKPYMYVLAAHNRHICPDSMVLLYFKSKYYSPFWFYSCNSVIINNYIFYLVKFFFFS